MKLHSYYKKLIINRLSNIFYNYTDIKDLFEVKFESFIENKSYIEIRLALVNKYNKYINLDLRIDPNTDEIIFCIAFVETWGEIWETLNRENLFEYLAVKFILKQE